MLTMLVVVMLHICGRDRMQSNLDTTGRSLESLKMTLFWIKIGEETKIFPSQAPACFDEGF